MVNETDTGESKKLGKYIIQSELGQGAMGMVFKGFDPHIERTVAIKSIRKDLLDNNEVITRFKREAQAAGRLNHPNIVSVYEYGEEGEAAYIAMEYVRGRSLKDIFDNNERFDISDIVRIMSQILGALSYSHKMGVVHRDIKPANIILTDNGQVKITDFGVAHLESSELTQTGMIIGTPNYMSPEQFMGVGIDGRSDLFSVGILLYRFLTGENPFDGRSMATIMHKVLNVEPLDVHQLNLHIPPDFDRLIKKALCKKPEKRFQTAEDFYEAINHALQSESYGKIKTEPNVEAGATVVLSSRKINKDPEQTVQTPVSDDISGKREKTTGSKQYLRPVFGLLFLLIMGGGIYLFFRQPSAPEPPSVDELPLAPGSLSSSPSSDLSSDSEAPNPSSVSAVQVQEDSLDTSLPEGKLIGLKGFYTSGEDVRFTIQVTDDIDLENVFFQVSGTSVKENWDLKGRYLSLDTSFSTKGWQAKSYKYILTVEDRSGKSAELSGSFEIRKNISGIIRLNTHPKSANVFMKNMLFSDDTNPPLDYLLTAGRFVGKTPLRLETEAGVYEFSFVKEGYDEVVVEVEIEAGDEVPLDLDMIRSGKE